jgi:Fe-S-cluster containining protein
MIEPSKIKDAAQRLEDENMRFRSFLKNRADEDELDAHFLELHNELFTSYDCRKCGNCCREYSTTVQEQEIDSIAAHVGLAKQDFINQHLSRSDEGLEIKAPCCFLKENGECAVYECRPEVCRDFPHTDKPGRLWSLLSVMGATEICPVVFEIVQRLKVIYRFRGRKVF